MRHFFENVLADTGAINIRDGFFGGRTGVERMFEKSEPGESQLDYFDVNSLYSSYTFLIILLINSLNNNLIIDKIHNKV